jgi:hypothetical protein
LFITLHKALGGGWETYQSIPQIRHPQPAAIAAGREAVKPTAHRSNSQKLICQASLFADLRERRPRPRQVIHRNPVDEPTSQSCATYAFPFKKRQILLSQLVIGRAPARLNHSLTKT